MAGSKPGRRSRAEELGLPRLLEKVVTDSKKLAVMRRLLKIAEEGSDKDSLKAIELLLAYVYGKPACAWRDEADDIHAGAQALHGWLPSFNADEMRAEPYSLLVLANQCRALGSPDGTIPLSEEHRTALVDAARVLRRNVSRIARGDHQQP